MPYSGHTNSGLKMKLAFEERERRLRRWLVVIGAGLVILIVWCLAMAPAGAEDSAVGVEHVGYVWSVGIRSSGGDEPESTYFVLCRKEVRTPTYGMCFVVWAPGQADVSVREQVRVIGTDSTVAQSELSDLKRRFLNGELSESEKAVFSEYLDVVNVHTMIRVLAYHEMPGYVERFDELPYVRAQSVERIQAPTER